MAQKPWIVPIPGTTQMAHMIQNAGASSVVLTPDELKELIDSLSDIHVQGQRLPDGVLALSGVEAPPKRQEPKRCTTSTGKTRGSRLSR